MALPALVFLALVAFAAALLWSPHAGRAAALHLILAVGAMPLIFGAMSHFIPVLTRTRNAAAGLVSLPVLALAGGALAVGALSLARPVLGALCGGAAGRGRSQRATRLEPAPTRRDAGPAPPLPGLVRNRAGLSRAGPARHSRQRDLAAADDRPAPSSSPSQHARLRRADCREHARRAAADRCRQTRSASRPAAAPRSAVGGRRHAAGRLSAAAWIGPLAWIGGALWAVPLVRLGASWLRLYRAEILALHGAAPLLAAALAGLAFSLIFGAMAPMAVAEWLRPTEPALAFVSGFMLPLVSGAASQLLPVWLRPGVQSHWHAKLRDSLGRYGGVRAVLFCLAGLRPEWASPGVCCWVRPR